MEALISRHIDDSAAAPAVSCGAPDAQSSPSAVQPHFLLLSKQQKPCSLREVNDDLSSCSGRLWNFGKLEVSES